MAAISVVEANADIDFVAANAGGDTVLSGTAAGGWSHGGVFVLVNNGGGAPITVTIDGVEHTVPNGELHALPANRGAYPDRALAVTYSAATSVTVAALRI
jgi:hypothetical protein